MIKLENYEVVGWEHAIRGMRNPMNSWEKSDTGWVRYKDTDDMFDGTESVLEHDFDWGSKKVIGPNDHELMMKLAKGGPVHAKYRRMITVYVDITAPLYWWKEFDTYKVGTVANSCSTMHKIHAKAFTLEDFSYEKLLTTDFDSDVNRYVHFCDPVLPINVLEIVIKELNFCRNKYLEAKTKPMEDEAARKELLERYFHYMIQLLPTSYNQKRTVMLNYEVLHNIYISRKNHKLDEWRAVCRWIEELPYSEIITGNLNKKPDFTNHDGSHDYD